MLQFKIASACAKGCVPSPAASLAAGNPTRVHAAIDPVQGLRSPSHCCWGVLLGHALPLS